VTEKEKKQIKDIIDNNTAHFYEGQDGRLLMDARDYISLLDDLLELIGSDVRVIIYKRIRWEDAE